MINYAILFLYIEFRWILFGHQHIICAIIVVGVVRGRG